MAFTFTWNAGFNALPDDTENASTGASRIRNLKSAIAERLVVDHSWAGDANDGKHTIVQLMKQTSDPAVSAGAWAGGLYSKLVAGVLELFYEDDLGNVLQITKAGGSNLQAFPIGSIFMAVVSTNPGTLLGYGTWSAWGTGRMPIALDAGNALINTPEETGGSANSVVVSHTHSVTDPGHLHTATDDRGFATALAGQANANTNTGRNVNTGSSTTGITLSTDGVSGVNANLPPFITCYMWKRTA